MKKETCGTCKHFGEVSDEAGGDTYHACNLIKFHDTYKGDIKNGDGAVVIDGSGYFAALLVEEDFGCNKWEQE